MRRIPAKCDCNLRNPGSLDAELPLYVARPDAGTFHGDFH